MCNPCLKAWPNKFENGNQKQEMATAHSKDHVLNMHWASCIHGGGLFNDRTCKQYLEKEHGIDFQKITSRELLVH